jgi:hypothetical protein
MDSYVSKFQAADDFQPNRTVVLLFDVAAASSTFAE